MRRKRAGLKATADYIWIPAFAEIKNSGRGKRSPTRLFAGFDRLLRLTARDPLHVVEQIVERLVGLIRHLRKRAQKAVGPRELEQRLLAILWRRRGYQHDIVERLQHEFLQRIAGPRYIFDDAAALALRALVEDRHAVGGAGRRGFDEGAGEGAQEGLVEAQNRGRPIVIYGRAHLQRGP